MVLTFVTQSRIASLMLRRPRHRVLLTYLGLIFAFILFLANGASLYAQEKIEVFPTTPFDRFIIYETLTLFWLGIIGLVIIIKMKLKEIERIQKMGIDREEKDNPILD